MARRLAGSPTLRSWLVSRAVVLAALLAADLTRHDQSASLLAWDGAWYDDIAVHGYAGAQQGAVRYFPVWPLLARGLAAVTGAPAGVLLVLLANAAALLYLGLAARVALAEQLGRPVADRMPAVVALAPAGVVLVMGYTEALFGVLLCLVLLSARRGRWLPCAAAGLLAGALRPTGVLLCVSVAIEAGRGIRAAGPAGVLARVTAAGAPAAGLAGYLAWTWVRYGDPLAPFHAQLAPQLRGGVLVNPLATVQTWLQAVRAGQFPLALPLHALWVVVALALLVVAARRLPASYTTFAAGTLFLAVTARNFSSFERYACSALPLLLAAGIVLAERPRLGAAVAVVAPLVCCGYALVTFLGWYVP